MRGISRSRSAFPWRFLFFFTAASLQFLAGLCDDPSSTKDNAKKADSGVDTRRKILFIFLGMVATGLLSFGLFKFWQKKKREEQYARLLKLFEEDDELEVELGLRD
ncbi:unnamed protein product [Linum tenue]|uniref:Transmembrane protein n=2 Tax=Linum TaxID=4005 RepID=A0AAV0M0I6_9ROSI|nr:unnamed protein product [Linum tenue]